MTCHEARELIEAVASGDMAEPSAFAAHVAECRDCGAALEIARRVERALAALPAPAAPAAFTRTVASAVRRQRWEYDQHVDRAFNVAVGIGITLIVVAIVSLLNVSALAQMLMAAGDAIAQLPHQPAPWQEVRAAPMAGIGMTVVAMGIGIWWWAERRSEFEGR